jgi:predicted nuclease of restriction endonuclease-like (RecB) superfamily
MTGAAFPEDFRQVLTDLERQVRASRAAAFRAVNAEMLGLYRAIGRTLLDRQRHDGWDAGAAERLGAELRAAFPAMRGLSPANLRYMRAMVEAWPDLAAQPPLEHLPWEHIQVLLDEVEDATARDWYARATVEHGWSRDVLLNQIKARSHLRGWPLAGAPLS